MEPFEEQLKFWTENGFVGDMIRISRNAERFVQKIQEATGEERPSSNARKPLMDSWNGFVHENVEILEELYQSDDFVMRWLESGNEKRKKDVLMRIHVAKACLVKREKTALATGDCAWCTLFPGEVKLKAEEIDHIIPFSFFPQFDGKEWNYQGLCKTHNSQKGSFPVPVQNKMPSQKMLHKIWAGLT